LGLPVATKALRAKMLMTLAAKTAGARRHVIGRVGAAR
jgi:hypothetical protein